MKIRFLILFILLLTPQLMEAATVKTVKGKLYRDVYFKEVTDKGLVFYFKWKTITFKPEELAPIYRKIYATQIEKYEKLAGIRGDDLQKKMDSEIDKLKNRPPAERLLPLASMRQFYTKEKYKDAKINFENWKQEVYSSFHAFELKALKMDTIEALFYIEQLKMAYQQYGILASELKKLHAKLSFSLAEQYSTHIEKLKTLKQDQKLKQAEKLYTVYKDLSVDRSELTNIIRDCKIEKGINMCKNTRSHASAISILNKLITENPEHPRLQEMKQALAKQKYLLQAKEDFAFLVSAYKKSAKNPARVISIMKKALEVYADTPYTANAKKQLAKWNEMEAEKERKLALERAEKERQHKLWLEREKQYRKQGWRPCPSCRGEGSRYNMIRQREEICYSCGGTGRQNA